MAILPNFIPRRLTSSLRDDAEHLFALNQFIPTG
jgi:hypothetical protein